jgi:ribosomal protein S11
MTPQEAKHATGRSFSQIGRALGISSVHIARAFRGEPCVGNATLIRIWRETGVKLGRIADATDDEIRVLERFEREAA